MKTKKLNSVVSVIETEKRYPAFPYDTEPYLKEALLDALEGIGCDRHNPFATYVGEGKTVLIKPNWVRDRNPLGHNIESLVTHSSLIAYVIDFTAQALNEKGKIIIADAPLQNCNFENLKKQTRIEEVVRRAQARYPNIQIIIEDWRITTLKTSDTKEQIVQKHRLTEENLKEEYAIIDRGTESFLEEVSDYAHRFRVTKYKNSLMRAHHQKGVHEYAVTKRIFEADLFINMPVLKTHIKAGLTGAMKNLVGINGHKEFLPHHIKGSYFEGGDNYSSSSWFRRKYEDMYDELWEHANTMSVWKRKFRMRLLQVLWFISRITTGENISAGSWSGNDTIWRTTLDLNHIAYFNSDKPTRVLNIVDGIIAGEGEGPLEPTPRPLGVLVVGENPVYVDAVIAQMMGYVVARIPTVYHGLFHRMSEFFSTSFHETHVMWKKNGLQEAIPFDAIPQFNFKKPTYWINANRPLTSDL